MVKKKERKALSKLFDACSCGQIDLIKQQLTDHPGLISMCDEKLYTALHISVLAGQLASVIMLLNWGADPNATTEMLKTPLYLSVRSGYLLITEKLIERGAEPWRKSNTSKTTLHAAVEMTSSDGDTGIALIKLLLYKRKFRPAVFVSFLNSTDSKGNTALQLAQKYLQGPILDKAVYILSTATPPPVDHEINILLHGWNDKLPDWEAIEVNFTQEVGKPFYLFAYDSLANRVSIGTLSEDLYLFIGEKLSLYRKQQKSSFTRLTNDKTTIPDDIEISVNIICYSTGGLIVRQFLQNHYRKDFRKIIDRVIFLAPANMGSPFAKFGKSQIGRIYTGQKKVGSLFECGEELLTSLEPNSPFIWDLAQKDVFEKEENQFFVPSEVMATIIQGTKHYPKNLQTKVTRGDMRGTDGTVTISGASLRAVKYSMNLSGGSKGKEILIEKSTSDIALRLHPAHTHRSLIDSLLEKTDVFFLVRRALETTREQFGMLQKSFDEENEIYYSSCHTPGNLLIFQYFGKNPTAVVPQILLHSKEIVPQLGQQVDSSVMKVESKASVIGTIREQFDYIEYHSRSRNMFYKIADLPLISRALVAIAGGKSGQHASLALTLKGQRDSGRIFASTAWIDQYGDCFFCSDMGTTSMFTIAPVLKEDRIIDSNEIEELPSLENSDNSTFALKSLSNDDCLDETLCSLGVSGIIRLCSLFHRDSMLEQFLRIVCRDKAEQLTGKTCAFVIRALVPFFSTTNIVAEACSNLILNTDSSQISAFKSEMDTDHVDESLIMYDNLPSPIHCETLHQLVFKLLKIVPFQFLKFGNNISTLAKYLSNDNPKFRGVWFVNLGVMIAETIFKVSDTLELEKPMKYLVFVEDTIQPEEDLLFSAGDLAYPGASGFLSKLVEPDNMDIVLIKCVDYQKPIMLEGVSYIVLSYENKYVIRQLIVEYLSLYPEYFYSIIANSIPVIFNAVIDLYRTYEGAWCLFMDSGVRNTPDVKKLESFGYNMCVGKTWIDAAINGYEQDLLQAIDVVDCSRCCVEELQLGLMRKMIQDSGSRWEDVICSLEEVQDLVSLLPSGTEKLACTVNADILHRSARESYASLLLSDDGIDMIIHFKKWLSAQKQQPNSAVIEKPNEILVDVAKSDALICQRLAHLFPQDSNLVPSVERHSNRTLNRGASSLMLQAKGVGNTSDSDSNSIRAPDSPVMVLPGYLQGIGMNDAAKPQYQSAPPIKPKNPAAFVVTTPKRTATGNRFLRRQSNLQMGNKPGDNASENSTGKPLPNVPTD